MATAFTRRKAVLYGLGGIAVVAAGGGVWRAWSNGVFHAGEGPAYEPWRNWRDGNAGGPLALVRAGILASNAHNSQPWRFQVSDDRVALFADPVRNLGSFDPFRREMFLSLGCALENMVLAARAEGYEPRVELTAGRLSPGAPVAAGEPAAVLHLSPGPRAESEFHRAIAVRHTHRGAYEAGRPVPETLNREMQSLAGEFPDIRLSLFGAGTAKDRLGELIVSATADIVADHQMVMDSARWFRFDWNSLERHRDGITLDAVGLPPLVSALAKIIPAPSPEQADRQWLTATRDVHVGTAALLGAISVRDLYDRPAALNAGRLWQKLHLCVAARGLAAQPLNQPAERVDRELELGREARMAAALAGAIGAAGWQPTFLFRMGYAASAARPSPRRPVDAVTAA